MTLSRRSFLKGLAALPLVAAFLPKEVPAETVEYFSTDGKRIFNRVKVNKFGVESPNFDGRGLYWKTYTGDIPVGTIVCFGDEYGSKVKPISVSERCAGTVVGKNVILMWGEFPTVFAV